MQMYACVLWLPLYREDQHIRWEILSVLIVQQALALLADFTFQLKLLHFKASAG
jgi:hypothetical protein